MLTYVGLSQGIAGKAVLQQYKYAAQMSLLACAWLMLSQDAAHHHLQQSHWRYQ